VALCQGAQVAAHSVGALQPPAGLRGAGRLSGEGRGVVRGAQPVQRLRPGAKELPQQPVDREDGRQAHEDAGRQDEGLARAGALDPAAIGREDGARGPPPVFLRQTPAFGDNQETSGSGPLRRRGVRGRAGPALDCPRRTRRPAQERAHPGHETSVSKLEKSVFKLRSNGGTRIRRDCQQAMK
jgi:hypothetical protein